MKILLLGANGQLGWQLRRSLSVLGELTALARQSSPWCGDVTDGERIAQTVRALTPDVIVNATAYTALDRAEGEPKAAFAVNHAACETLAREAQRSGAWLVHYSTECVFDGSGERPWRETDPTGPLSVYGRSKLAGEQAIARECHRHLILRTSWLFDTCGKHFLKTILSAAQQRETLDVVGDQWGAPTRSALLADVTGHLLRALEPARAGIYHVASSGYTSRHGFAVYALECAQRHGLPLKAGPGDLRAVASAQYRGSVAHRPANGRLDSSLLEKTFALRMPAWQQGVAEVVAELGMLTYKTA